MSNLKDVATDSSLIPSTETTLPIPIKARLYEYHGFLIGIFSALLLSLSNILNKKAHITTGAEQTFIRYLIQASFMVIIIKKEKLDFFGPKEFRKILILRGVFGTVGLIALQYSVKLINPSDAVALLHLNSVMVIIFARVYLNEKFTIFHLVCLLTALIGVVFIAQPTFIFDKITNSKNNITEILETHLAPPKGHEFIIGIFLGIIQLRGINLKLFFENIFNFPFENDFNCFLFSSHFYSNIVRLGSRLFKKTCRQKSPLLYSNHLRNLFWHSDKFDDLCGSIGNWYH